MNKKSLYQKFLDFKTRHNMSNEEIAKIALEYANTDLTFSRSYFMDKYNISDHVFYQTRDFAIIFCLVDKGTYERIKKKSSTNQKNNVNNTSNRSTTSVAYFDELLVKQQEFLDEFSKNEIIDIGKKYVEGISLKNIAIAYDTGEYGIKRLLKKGIIELIFDNTIVSQISIMVGPALNRILQKRKINKERQLSNWQNKISSLRLQINHYDSYFKDSRTKPTLESLKQDLQKAIEMYNETLRL